MRETKKIVFIVGSLSQPRCIKRILSFANAGYDCEVYGYDKKKYNCNALPNSIKVSVLGELVDGGDYLKKMRIRKRDTYNIIKHHKSESPIYYSFSFISSLALFLKRQRYIYEISDIFYGYPRFSKVIWLLKALDKRIIKKSILTVMTSEGFREFFKLEYDNIVVQPNKVNRALINYERKPILLQKDSGLVFSFVGAIRYDTIFRFAETVGRCFPKHEFHFYGEATGQSLEKCTGLAKLYPNIKYFGAFKNPQDLPKIYEQVNVVVACYATFSLNERLAEPNKLYESMFFCKPIIVSDGIFLSRQVKKYKCGFCIDASSEQSIVDYINGIDFEEINKISKRESEIDVKELVDNPALILQKFNF